MIMRNLTLLALAISLAPTLAAQPAAKVFIFSNASRDVAEFRRFAQVASRLKPYGQVQINIGVLADKSWHEVPKGGSPWHDYASYVSTPAKFFPHPKIAPHFPAEWVAKNRALLLAKAAVLRELGLEAAFTGKETHLLPESFFRQYPHLRGPRVDHPRRSKEEAFSWCVDLEETREMIEWTTAELKRNVPQLRTILTGTNDAGAGMCWAAALYSGPNGPQHCRNRNAGVRLRDAMAAVHRGAEKGGGKVRVRIANANFWQNEEDVILPLLPPDTYLNSRDPSLMSVGTLINEAYPAQGLINPLAVLSAMERFDAPRIGTVLINTTTMYARADEPPETVGKLLDMVEDCIREPAHGLSARLNKLRKLAARWGGERNAERLFEAFYRMDEALRLKQAVAPRYSNFYCGVSMRHLTRPLLIKPDLLAPEEESYFLPHVFNIHQGEARNDYIDLHGSRITGPARWEDAGLRNALNAALGAARTFESLRDAPEGKWLNQLALSLEMWVSEVRSIHNFYFAQLIRDRNSEALAGPARIPEKVETWTGDPDYLAWNEIQRAELDNANELLGLLEKGGLALVSRAKDPVHEDTFVMGPDITGALKRKTAIMRQHWLDIQQYLASPHK